MFYTLAQSTAGLTKSIKGVEKGIKKEQKSLDMLWSKIEPWMPYIYAIIAVVVLYFIVRWFMRRRKAKNDGRPALSAKDLIRGWRDFLKAIPADFRRTIVYYNPFVVMGAGSTGKTQLIDKYTDSQGLSRQFYPSYNSGSDVQFNMGTQSSIQEVSQSILEDSSKEARSALKKFWKQTFTKGKPTVMLTLPVDKLESASAQLLKKQAQLFRGKINVLAWQHKSPIRCRLVLTYMDSISGYKEFCKLVESQDIEFSLNFGDCSAEAFGDILKPYEKFLSLALTTLPAEDYLKIISFFNEAPKLFSRLSTFCKALRFSEPLSPSPIIQQVLLASSLDEDKLCQPFYVPAIECITQKWTRRRHLKFAAILFLSIFAYGALGYYLEDRRLDNVEAKLNKYEKIYAADEDILETFIHDLKELDGFDKNFLYQLDDKLQKLEDIWPENAKQNIKVKLTSIINELRSKHGTSIKDAVKIQRLISAQLNNAFKALKDKLILESETLDSFPELNFFPPFFQHRSVLLHAKIQEEQNYLEKIRKQISSIQVPLADKIKEWWHSQNEQMLADYRKLLETKLKECSTKVDSQGPQLKLLTIIYTGIDNNLKDVVHKYLHQWSEELGLLPADVKKYIDNNHKSWDKPLSIDSTQVRDNHGNSINLELPVEFYTEVHSYLQSEVLSIENLEHLHKLGKGVQAFVESLEEKKQWIELVRIFSKEKEEISLPTTWLMDATELEEVENPVYRRFVKVIYETELGKPNCKDMSLEKFLAAAAKFKDEPKQVKKVAKVIKKELVVPLEKGKKPGAAKDKKSKAAPKKVRSLAKKPIQSKELKFNLLTIERSFNISKWEQLIRRSRLSLLINGFVNQQEKSGDKIFFTNRVKYRTVELSQAVNDYFIFFGKGTIKGRYTNEAFEKSVLPIGRKYLAFHAKSDAKENIDTVDKIQHEYTVMASERMLLYKMINRAMKAYSEEYNRSMKNYALALSVKANSMVDLSYVLQQIPKPFGTFGLYLNKLHSNANIKIDKDNLFEPMRTAVKEFSYLKSLMKEEKGHFPELENYHGILQMMEKELANEAPEKEEKDIIPTKKKTSYAFDIPRLDNQLTPIAKMTLGMFRQRGNSYYRMIHKWLDSLDVPQEYRSPFLSPARSAYRLGANALQLQMTKNWELLVQKILIPMNEHIPFNMNAPQEISPEELTSILGKEGSFWQYYESMLGPVCELRDGRWRKTSVTNFIKLPSSMLPTLNRLQQLRTVLWDDNGQKKVLNFHVDAGLLPDSGMVLKYFNALPSLAYFNCGNSSALGFNQKSQWQKIKLEWWNPHVAATGIQFTIKDTRETVFAALNSEERNWSIFHLLNKAEQVKDNKWLWGIDISNAIQSIDHDTYARLNAANGPFPKFSLNFTFREDLPQIFRLDLDWAIRKEIDEDIRKIHIPKEFPVKSGKSEKEKDDIRNDHLEIFDDRPKKKKKLVPPLDIKSPEKDIKKSAKDAISKEVS